MEEYLGKPVTVIVDRPIGSRHPSSGTIYPVNYGFVPGTCAGDGEEIDAYILGVHEPIKEFRGRVIAIIRRRNDSEDKLVVARTLDSYSTDQVKALTEFMERHFDSEVIAFYSRAPEPKIRVVALGMARRGSQLLVTEGYDIVKDETFYRFPGGGVEFGEESAEALRREFGEELAAELLRAEYIGALENLFIFEGKRRHEIILLYEVDLPESLYQQEEFPICENGMIGKALWVDRTELLSGRKVFYPRGIERFI